MVTDLVADGKGKAPRRLIEKRVAVPVVLMIQAEALEGEPEAEIIAGAMQWLRDDGPWFVAKDICDALGLTHTARALEKLDEEEWNQIPLLSAGGKQMTYIVSESGLYAMILRSDKPAARVFRRWVTAEVLPQIRKTGSYTVPGIRPDGALVRLAQIRAEIQALQAEASRLQGRAAEEIREALALPNVRLALPVPDGLGENRPKTTKPRIDWPAHVALLQPGMTAPELTRAIVQAEGCRHHAAACRVSRMVLDGRIYRHPETHRLYPNTITPKNEQ